jgi:hypothetical protein
MDDFLREFLHRRVEEAVNGRKADGLWQSVVEWFRDPGLGRWAYGAGLAYAAVFAVMLMFPKGQQQQALPTEAIDHQVIVPVEQPNATHLQELDFRATTEGLSGEQEF